MRDARTINPESLYDRRKQAIMLYKQGMKRIDIAPIVGVHRNTVGEWISIWKTKGLNGLRVAKAGCPVGLKRLLLPHEEKEIQKCLVDKCPDQLKLPFALWTRMAVKMLIKESYNIDLPIRTMGNYLKRWGFTPQKPVTRAYERNENHVQKWLNEGYPTIKETAKKEGAEIHWGDETGLRSDDVNGRGYAPKGKTPVRRTRGARESLNMISTVTNQGKVRFMFYKDKMCGDLLIKFMKRLIRSTDRKVFLVLDNLPVHHGRIVKDFLAENSAFIRVFYLPSYSPDLNPDEHLNGNLKANIRVKPTNRKKGDLEKNAKAHMFSIQKRPKHIQSFFQSESVKYAS